VRLLAIALAAAAIAAVTAPALAAYPPWVLVIRDCADDGKIDGTYRPQDYAEALKNVPSDGGEYTDCANAIRHELLGGSGKSHAPPAPNPNAVVTESGAVAASPDDAAQLEVAIASADADAPPAASVSPGGGRVAPGEARVDPVLSGLQSAAPRYRLDTALLAVILAAGVIAISVATVGRRLTAQR
jgi:hypothetical protein